MAALLRHSFTHHLRELERLLWLAVTTTREPFVALTKEVEAELRLPTVAPEGEELTEESIRTALASSQGNVSQAARKLGLKNRYVLYRLMRRYGLESASNVDDE
ncbi:hypothetical protein AKJ09_02601 [Labilithrix luteola]|uniref:DNA binding HTH domain-containing protein n=1 Tax=Labilithrix luteola TaxID=1391654 RepID=A0A0K1PQY5_9BACT|nr:helix-turn-helix domain-containing protein [Labilithrix luteola]AKU95937.1 hypothetical protein AKJ09_02601 [Labilithrix luteola]